MKRIAYIISAALLVLACDSRLDDHLRLVPKDDSIPVPTPLTITGFYNTPGGAVIKVAYPDDDIVRGAIATYVRNGEKVSTKVSRYVDSLVVVGYPDTNPHEVSVATFNVNEVQSESQKVTITPLIPAIATVKPEITSTFGGVKILVQGNEAKNDLAVCLLRDGDLSDEALPIKDRKWVEVTTLFTANNNIQLTRRGIDPEEALFAVYFRDHWGNISDTTVAKVTPIEENKINHSTFYDASLPDDNCKSGSSSYPVIALWDDSGASSAGHFFACDNAPRPCWLTIGLGQTAQLSRVHTLPRIDYTIWANAHPRIFEFWGWGEEANPKGSENINNPYGFETGWVKLGGPFEQFKPSGYQEDGSVGDWDAEDREYFNNGNDFEFDVGQWPHANDPIRYLRVVFIDNFQTYNTGATMMAVQIGEIAPYGKVVQ